MFSTESGDIVFEYSTGKGKHRPHNAVELPRKERGCGHR